MRRSHGPMLKNRIVGRGEEPPDQLLANPANAWKIHPEEQQDEVEKVMEQVGWVREILVNKRTGYVVDGHLRVQLAIKRGEESVPVTYVDVDEHEEKLLIGVLDPLAAMSARDNEKLDELLTDLKDVFPETEIDLDAILKREKRERTKGLTHTVHACTCCQGKCKPGCGCFVEEDAPPEPQRYPVRHVKKKRKD
jgi:ParB-like chromosome segregation protein Spo0J